MLHMPLVELLYIDEHYTINTLDPKDFAFKLTICDSNCLY